MSFNFYVYLLLFKNQDDSSICESKVLKSSTIIMLGLICGFIFNSTYFMKLSTSMFGEYCLEF